MEFRVLAIGDVTSEEGTAHLRRHLPGFKKMKGVDFTVINGENISGTGLTPQQADDLFAAGADVITLGNHTWGKMQITDYLEENREIVRALVRGTGVEGFGRKMITVLEECHLEMRPFRSVEDAYAARFLATGIVGMMEKWITEPQPIPKNEIVELINRVLTGNLI